jgi:dolichol kinase
MIGNLPLMMPFFTDRVYPFLVASPFILVTLLVTPYSPLPGLTRRLGGLAEITEEGHHTGLVLYALSYSILAWLYGVEPYIVAAGIFPMAYGDSSAALIGERFGAHRYRVFEAKSVEGSLGMLAGSLISLLVGMLYFSLIYGFSFAAQIVPCLVVAAVTTVAEAVSPRSIDNLSVPLLGALTFIVMGGGP